MDDVRYFVHKIFWAATFQLLRCAMFEQQYVLNKIEQWAERLPYRTLRIEVELPRADPHSGEKQGPAH